MDLSKETQNNNKTRLYIYGILIAFEILALIFIFFFTKAEKERDAFTRELDRIFKKYGDRLVAINNSLNFQGQFEVKSMEDLVRLADELNRPILYKYSDNPKEIDKFFINQANEVHVFYLKDYIKGESHGSLQKIPTN